MSAEQLADPSVDSLPRASRRLGRKSLIGLGVVVVLLLVPVLHFARLGWQVTQNRTPLRPVAQVLSAPFPAYPGSTVLNQFGGETVDPAKAPKTQPDGAFTLYWDKSIILDVSNLSRNEVDKLANFYVAHVRTSGLKYDSLRNSYSRRGLYESGREQGPDDHPYGERWEMKGDCRSVQGVLTVHALIRDSQQHRIDGEDFSSVTQFFFTRATPTPRRIAAIRLKIVEPGMVGD